MYFMPRECFSGISLYYRLMTDHQTDLQTDVESEAIIRGNVLFVLMKQMLRENSISNNIILIIIAYMFREYYYLVIEGIGF